MRIFKYWSARSAALNIEGGFKQQSKTFGGSNVSLTEADKDADRRLEKAQQIISGLAKKDPEYEANILEEIIDIIDADNIVTRNRYGALVLNAKHTLFIDVDHYTKSLPDYIFRSSWSLKQLMLAKIEKTMAKSAYAALGFRVYETCKGYRILVTNAAFDPRSKSSKAIMRDFNADTLYQELCLKQNCYRARLTPKPYRIKQKRLKMVYPNRTEEQQREHAAWVEEYEQNSKRFASCRLVKQHGRVRTNSIIDYHDRATGILQLNQYPLA